MKITCFHPHATAPGECGTRPRAYRSSLPAKLTRWVAVLCAAIWWACPASAQGKELYQAVYAGEYSSWDVEMTRSLIESDPGVFEFRSEAKNLFATIREQSEFTVLNGQVRPQRYEYARSIFGRKKTEVLNFDWQAASVTYLENGKVKHVHKMIDANASDPALYQLLLQLRFQNQDLTTTEFEFFKRRHQKHYTFTDIGDGPITLNGKTYTAVGLVRRAQDKQTHVWLLPELDYVIGKLEHHDDGDVYTLELARYRADRKALVQFYKALE